MNVDMRRISNIGWLKTVFGFHFIDIVKNPRLMFMCTVHIMPVILSAVYILHIDCARLLGHSRLRRP